MALADIKTKIEGEARQEAEGVLARAKAQADQIAAKAAEEVRLIEQAAAKKIAAEKPEIERRRQIVAGLDVRREELDARRAVMRKAVDAALESLRALPAKKVESFMTRLLEQAMQTKTEELLVGKQEKVLTKAWLDAFNAAHGSCIVYAEEKLPKEGGFILRNGRIDVNCTYEKLIASLEDDLETEIVERLFA